MIVLLTSLWDRPDIEAITIDYYAELRNSLKEVPIVLAAAYSRETQPETLKRARFRNWQLFDCPAEPLGLKLNTAMRAIGASNAFSALTHVVTFGSDDLIHEQALRILLAAGGKYPAAGFVGAYFLCTVSWRAAHFQYAPGTKQRPCGAGRILTRQVLEALKWTPRNDLVNRGLDGSMDERLRAIGVNWKILENKSLEAPVLDVKTGRNIWPFSHLMDAGACLVDPEEVCDSFGDPWATRLRGLRGPRA